MKINFICNNIKLQNVNLEGSKMHRVNLRIASMKNANVQNCILDYACLSGANLGKTNYI